VASPWSGRADAKVPRFEDVREGVAFDYEQPREMASCDIHGSNLLESKDEQVSQCCGDCLQDIAHTISPWMRDVVQLVNLEHRPQPASPEQYRRIAHIFTGWNALVNDRFMAVD
jgi:hypothetical protein